MDNCYLKLAEQQSYFSYSPYSNIKVGCVIVSNIYNIYKGSNVENKSYGATICAERSAICNFISHRIDEEIKEIYLYSEGFKNFVPCGICLQFLSEVCKKPIKIITSNDKEVNTYTLSQLLPNIIL